MTRLTFIGGKKGKKILREAREILRDLCLGPLAREIWNSSDEVLRFDKRVPRGDVSITVEGSLSSGGYKLNYVIF